MSRLIDASTTAEIISNKFGIPIGDLVDVFAEIPTEDKNINSIKKIMCNSYCKFKSGGLDYTQLDMICETCPLTEVIS